MRSYLKGEYFDSGFLIGAVCTWFLCASLLLVISSVLMKELGCSEQSLAYVSSLISFVSALSAGAAASRKRKGGALYTALLTATVIVTALLTIGFLISGQEMDPSAIMSIISFTYSGCLVGVFFTLPKIKKKHYRPRI